MKDNLVVTMSRNELADLITDKVKCVLSEIIKPEPKAPEKMGIAEAVDFLCKNGYRTSKSSVQKMCATSRIPHCKICGKCIFVQKELLAFIENQTIKKG
jgi:hypothetical protein